MPARFNNLVEFMGRPSFGWIGTSRWIATMNDPILALSERPVVRADRNGRLPRARKQERETGLSPIPRPSPVRGGYGLAFNQSIDFCSTCIAYTGLCTPSESSLLMYP